MMNWFLKYLASIMFHLQNLAWHVITFKLKFVCFKKCYYFIIVDFAIVLCNLFCCMGCFITTEVITNKKIYFMQYSQFKMLFITIILLIKLEKNAWEMYKRLFLELYYFICIGLRILKRICLLHIAFLKLRKNFLC